MLFRLWSHEMRLLLREPRFWLPFLLPPLVLLGAQLWMLRSFAGSAFAADPRLLYTTGVLLVAMGGTLSADSFAGERERNTLELLLSLPVPLRLVFWAKVLALLPVPLVLAFVAQALSALLLGATWTELLGAYAYSLSLGLLLTGLSVLVSLRAPTVRSAGQTSAILVLVALLSTQWLAPWLAASVSFTLVFCGLSLGGFALALRLALKRFA